MIVATVAIYAISGVLGAWSATLLWRLLIERYERRRLKPGAPRSMTFTLRQRRLGVGLVLFCLPVSVAGAIIAEWVAGLETGRLPLAGLILVAAAALLFMLAAGAACAGWFFDPPRGRRRCPSCWYELPGDPALCTECGRRHLSERRLLRTRRSRPLLALGAALLLVSCGLFFVRVVHSGRATSLIPTSVMIAGLSWLPDRMLIYEEGALGDRLGSSSLSLSQTDALQSYCQDVIKTSTDPETLDRMCEFYLAYFNDPVGRPRLNQQAAASLIADLLSSNSRTAGDAYLRLTILSPFMSRLDASRAEPFLPLLRSAMTGPSARAREAAYQIGPAFAMASDTLVPIARAQFLDQSARPDLRLTALQLLVDLSVANEKAWDDLIACIDADSSFSMYVISRDVVTANAAVFEPRLLKALQHNSDHVAAWAASSLYHLNPDRTRHMTRIIDLMDARPGVAVSTITPLMADGYLLPALETFIIKMLDSNDAQLQDAALRVCVEHPEAASTRFLMPLERLRARTDGARNVQVLRVIERVKEAAGPPIATQPIATPSTPPDGPVAPAGDK